ncbi:MAG: hypothetical protein ACJ8R9_19400 [Steroidobacteraceae bacterium]
MNPPSSVFQRLILPGFALKAVVIGGGYATGRELATFFLPSGPWGGLYGMLLSMLIWSVVCALTFVFALQTRSLDYRTFFRHLLGRLWPVFEVSFALAMVVILAVYAAAAGAIGEALLGWPPFAGSLLLVVGIVVISAFGNEGVERLFKYVTYFLYSTYALFVLLSLTHFGGRIVAAFDTQAATTGWATGGLMYAGYNIFGAVVILPVVRHMTGQRDALIAGLLAGPMAMLPAILFFMCMMAYYPQITAAPLPSDYLLERLNIPVFRALFQIMIFTAVLESATGGIHAVNERVAHAYQETRGRVLPTPARLAVTCVVLVVAVFVATRFGLVALIASGYSWLAVGILTTYVLPLITLGLWRILRRNELNGGVAASRPT